MKRLALCLILALPLTGCPASNAPTPPVAPGYINAQDQQIGEALAALNGFVNQEKVNYAAMPPVQQGKEKPILNDLITAVNIANASYQAFHAGSQTEAQAQTAINAAQAKQTTLVAAKEAH